MDYELTATYNNGQSRLHVALYETAPPIGEVSKEFLALEIKLLENQKYEDWQVFPPLGTDWRVSAMTANGVNLEKVERPFSLQYGFILFEVTLVCVDGRTKTLYSKYCPALETEEKENLQEILRKIKEIDDPVLDLMRWPSSQPGKESERVKKPQKYSMFSGVLQQGEGADSAHSPLQNVFDVYEKHSGHFAVRPEHTIRKSLVATPFHRVKSLNRESMLWSAQQGNLHKVPSGGIQVGEKHYMPMETLSEVAKRDYHIYENGIILGFLDTVLRKMDEKEDLESQEGFDILRMIFFPGESVVGEPERESIEALKRRYQRALKLEERKIPRVNNIPKQTKRFQEILPYREIYRCIYNWFRSGTSWSFDNNSVFHGNLADTIYEYFCWEQLLQLFLKKGYYRCRESRRTNYGDRAYIRHLPSQEHGYEYTMPPFSNVVYMENGETKVTLYYTPRIFTWNAWKEGNVEHNCDISLVRTAMEKKGKGRQNNFWEPDFMVRVEKEGRVEYAILDAKFRSADALLRNNGFEGETLSAMEECLYKYYLTVSDVERLECPVRMMWLLQGRAGKRGREASFEPTEKQQIVDRLEYFPQSFFDDLSFGVLPMNGFDSSAALERLWEEFERVWKL